MDGCGIALGGDASSFVNPPEVVMFNTFPMWSTG